MSNKPARSLIRSIASAFLKDERGNVAIIAAFVGLILVGLVFGAIDLNSASNAKQRLQNGLDAATLFAARSAATTNAELQAIGMNALNANLPAKRPWTLGATTFTASADGTVVTGVSKGISPTTISGLFGRAKLDIGATSEVRRASTNVEVALVLDTTGSMVGQKIIDLRAAAKQLVDIVVKDQQTPYYSKVAIVPYSMAVNVGGYADAVRGSVPAAKTIKGATNTGSGNIVITATGHGFQTNDKVYINGIAGLTKYGNGLNGLTHTITRVDSNSFKINGTKASDYSKYQSGGRAYCVTAGCQFYSFTNADGNARTYEITTCVTERTGGNAYTDVAPSTALVGRNYRAIGEGCSTPVISPLTSDKTAIKNSIDDLDASGSTGGHIGVAWGWYMVSPSFGYLWPSATSRPAAYTAPDLLKVVVLMTDGEYNSSYCNGVISKDSTSGSGGDDVHINCNATNGQTFAQAMSLCANMKADQKVVVYTVGFNVVDDQRARDLVNNCATDSSHVYLPSGGAALKDAFSAIGRDIAAVRLSR